MRPVFHEAGRRVLPCLEASVSAGARGPTGARQAAEEPGPQWRTLAPASSVAMEPQEGLHHEVVRRRRVVDHPRQVPTELLLPAPEERLERRRVPRAIVR